VFAFIKRKANIDTSAVETEPIQLETVSDDEKYHIDDAVCDSFDHVLFISDVPLEGKIKEKLASWPNIVSYSSNFTNRTTDDLLAADIKHIWINISVKDGRRWLEENLKNNKKYRSICVYKGTSRNKFLKQLEPHVDMTVKMKNLDKIQALTFSELRSKVENTMKITSPGSCLADLLGCSSSITPKKNA
jgi:hypothetical protein